METILLNYSKEYSKTELEEIIWGFQTKTLSKERWTHEAHLITGLWYVLHYDAETAYKLMSEGIKSYNVAVGGMNTATSGYHDTLTRFWLWAIRKFLQTTDKKLSYQILSNQLVSSHFANKALPFEFYSKEWIFTVEARLGWVEADLKKMERV
jgi:hypothetical protein